MVGTNIIVIQVYDRSIGNRIMHQFIRKLEGFLLRKSYGRRKIISAVTITSNLSNHLVKNYPSVLLVDFPSALSLFFV